MIHVFAPQGSPWQAKGGEVVSKLVECVPNFSEGRRPEVIQAITNDVLQTPGVRVLDVQADAAHNRCVLSFVGPPEAVSAAALAAVRRAVSLIDMNTHQGEHPRIGAADVIPFVPIAGVTMDDCVALAHALGQQLWAELRLPVFFYAAAATRPSRQRLPDIRQGEYEGLRAKLADPAWAPDVGEAAPHPTAGVAVVGARWPLIAYNMNLTTDDVEIARKIARSVRESSGGLAHVQAIGVRNERGGAQVSLNLLDFRKTPMYHVFERVQHEAMQYGIDVTDTEIIGLLPLEAVVDVTRMALRLATFAPQQILETRLMG